MRRGGGLVYWLVNGLVNSEQLQEFKFCLDYLYH